MFKTNVRLGGRDCIQKLDPSPPRVLAHGYLMLVPKDADAGDLIRVTFSCSRINYW